MLAEILYASDPDECCGDVCETGLWVGLVRGKRYDYIVTENSQGFVDYAIYAKGAADAKFAEMADDMADSEDDEDDGGA